MPGRNKVKEVHETLKQYLHNRSDLGVWKAVTTCLMEARNPFEPESRRKPRHGLLVFSIFWLMAVAAVIYFNCWK